MIPPSSANVERLDKSATTNAKVLFISRSLILFESDWKREAIMSESRATSETLRSMTRASIAVSFGYQA
jgi:hypothetical protein